MFTRLAYLEVGVVPPEGDLYAIPRLQGHRNGVKKAMNCFLFDDGPRRSWPAEFLAGVDRDHDDHHDDHENGSLVVEGDDPGRTGSAALLPAGWGVARTKKAILKVHPVLKDAWGRQLGYHLMCKESEVLIAVLRHLASLNIPALGLHDGLMVAASRKEIAQEAMKEAAREIVGVALPVAVKDT
jgi:hypothetical protein